MLLHTYSWIWRGDLWDREWTEKKGMEGRGGREGTILALV